MSFYNEALLRAIKNAMIKTKGKLFRSNDSFKRLFDSNTDAYKRAAKYLRIASDPEYAKQFNKTAAFPFIKNYSSIERQELFDKVVPLFNANNDNRLYNPLDEIISKIELNRSEVIPISEYENALIKAINDRTPESPRIGNIEQLFSGQNNKLVDEFSNNFDNIVRNNSFSDNIIDSRGNKINFDILNMNDKNIQYFDQDDLQNILQENTDVLDSIAEPSLMKILKERFRELEGY